MNPDMKGLTGLIMNENNSPFDGGTVPEHRGQAAEKRYLAAVGKFELNLFIQDCSLKFNES